MTSLFFIKFDKKTMITNCLEDWIGVQGCGNTEPPSGVYLNDLAGIEIKKIDEIANDEQQNYVGVFSTIKKRALRKLQKDIRNAFLQKYKLKGVAQSVNIGSEIDTNTTFAGLAQYRGIKIELNEPTDDVVYSVLQAIYLQHIKVYVASGSPTFNLKVFDLDTETELYSKSVSVTTNGWQTVELNKHFRVRRIFVCYDATGFDSVSQNIEEFELDNCFKCKAQIRGGYSATGSPYSVTQNTYETYGLSVIMNIECVWDTLVCNNKDVFTQALLYLMGIEFVIEWINSDRINRWTMIDTDKAKWLLSYYTALYKGGVFEEIEYDSELLTAINQFDVDKHDCCVECSGGITFQNAYI